MNKFTQKILNKYNKVRNNKIVLFINNTLSSAWGIAFFAILTIFAHIFSLELLLYVIVGLTTLYICAFCEDFLPLIPLFIFCYIAPSQQNNPALTTSSIFYNETSLCIIIIIAICIPAIILRIALDKNIGFKKFVTQDRKLLNGICFLGIAYFMSGLGTSHYNLIAWQNILFSVLQFLSIFLLYYLFTATVNWKNVNTNYLAWLGLFMGLVVSVEILNLYITSDVIQNGIIVRSKLYCGWGHYNNMGALIAMAIPFSFSLACKYKHNYIFIITSIILLLFLFMSCSRGSIVCGTLIFIISFFIAFFKAQNRKLFRLSTMIFIILSTIIFIIFNDLFLKLFEKVPSIINSTNGNISFNDSSRFIIYKEGWKAFLLNPIFGQSFYSKGFIPYDFSILESFSTFFPPRWHNTIIQILSSCGVLGIVAYSFHRIQTLKLFIQKPSTGKTYIGLSILVFLLMSLLDCHFFNIGPTLFYSIALAVAENSNPAIKCKK